MTSDVKMTTEENLHAIDETGLLRFGKDVLCGALDTLIYNIKNLDKITDVDGTEIYTDDIKTWTITNIQFSDFYARVFRATIYAVIKSGQVEHEETTTFVAEYNVLEDDLGFIYKPAR